MISSRRVRSLLVSLVFLSVAIAAPTIAQVPTGSGGVGAPTRGPDRPSWGGADRVLYAVGHSEFTPSNSSTSYTGSFRRYSTVPFGEFIATPHIPSGVLLTYLELDYCDETASGNVLLALFDCNYLMESCNSLGGQISSGSGPQGCDYVSIDLTPLGYITNNNSRRFFLIATTESGTVANQIIGAYIGYKLQVSPAPMTATFPVDVPTGHPFFRFVEALADAGITAGTGPGTFSPDAPVTRGQMAVFLSVALGLHFPN